MELAEKVEFNSQLRQILQADGLQGSSGREGTMFFSSLPLPPAQEHSEIYLQLCMWDDYDVSLIALYAITRLLTDGIYHLIELPLDWLWWNANLFFFTLQSSCKSFIKAVGHRKSVDMISHRLSSFYYKQIN